jgi:hypothetical protein
VPCPQEVLRILKRLLEVFKGFTNSKKGWKNPTMINLKKAAEVLRETRPDIKKFSAFHVCQNT